MEKRDVKECMNELTIQRCEGYEIENRVNCFTI